MAEAVTPDRASPVRKHLRQFSPSAKSSRTRLFVCENEHAPAKEAVYKQQSAHEDTLLSKLNIDDLDTSNNSQLKV